MLAAKTSLAVRYDALGEDVDTEMGIQHRAKLEAKIRFFEEGGVSYLRVYSVKFFFSNFVVLTLSIMTCFGYSLFYNSGEVVHLLT